MDRTNPQQRRPTGIPRWAGQHVTAATSQL